MSKSPDKEHQPPQKRVPCVFLDAGFHLAQIFDMNDAEAGAYFKRLLLAINIGKRGVMPEADAMMEEAQAYYDQKREAGRKGGLSTQGKPSSGASSDASSHTDIHSGIQTDINTERESQGAAGAAALSQFEIPSSEIFKAFGAERGFPAERVEKCFRHYETSGWKDRDGKPIGNWRAALSSWMNRPELAAPCEAGKLITPEDSKRKETEARRKQAIRWAAERVVAMQSWIDSGRPCPFEKDPQAEIDKARDKIRSAYNESGLDDLSKTVADMQAESAMR